jgi:predicted ATPase
MGDMTANESFPVEKLSADNFLSLHEFKYEAKQFNVITGDIASGKSLIIKTLEFFSNIFSDLLTNPYEKFIECLNIKNFNERIIKNFDRRFHLEKDVLFDISYSCTYMDETFEIKLSREKKGEEISVKSEFLEKELEYWKDYIKDKKFDAPYKFAAVRNELSIRISKKFNNLYPPATTFIPATRAALAIGKSNFLDYYLMEYQDLIGFLKRFQNSNYVDEIHSILKATIKINGDILLISKDNREVKLANASSGQQEIFYILVLLDKLIDIKYLEICKQHYVFIEEPEAHMFPGEQKQVLELIVRIFNDINNNPECTPVKIFITTHSPYVLNVINNSLLKGSVYKKLSNNKKESEHILNNEKIKNIPPLDCKNLSAYYINDNGGIDNILEEYGDSQMISPYRIEDISRIIFEEYNILNDSNKKL